MTAVKAFLHFVWVAACLLANAADAHEGHDDATPGIPAVLDGGAPRVEANSDLFEIVAVIDSGVMTVYLDRYATNDPIVNAKIDVEIGAAKGVAQPNADGTYTFKDPLLSRPAQLPVTFAIAAGSEGDLLTAEVVIADPDTPNAHASSAYPWKMWLWTVGGLIPISMIASRLWLRRRQRNMEIVK
jgi:hypothetical protein